MRQEHHAVRVWIAFLFCFASAAFAPVSAQQFVDQTMSRFPQPDPLEYSSQAAIADIDNDGDLDIAFANGRGFSTALTMQRVRVLINDGAGFFDDETDARTGGFVGYGRDVEFGDVDGDDDLDMVVANDFNTRPKLLTNDGLGFFTDVSLMQMPAINLGSSNVALGDVDNDGDLDLWFTNGGASRFGSGQAQLYLNNGAGTFTNATATSLPALLVNSPMDANFGDIDGDFDLDMVEAHRDVQSKLYRNGGTGVFTDFTAGNLPPDLSTYSYDLGDIDDDGDIDLLGVNSAVSGAQDSLCVNNGSGTFTNMTSTLLTGSANPAVDDNDSKFFDIDYDGDLDLIVASLGSTERVCRNNGSGLYTLVAGAITAVADSSLDVEVGDLDGNGTLDVVTAQGESGSFINRVFMNTGVADILAPTFPAIEQLADTADTVGPYVVRVIMRDDMTSDHGFFLQTAELRYTVDVGPEQSTELRWMGGDVYRAAIPGQAAGSLVTYYPASTDFAGNSGTGTSRMFQVLGGGPEFDRGDCNLDSGFNIADAIFLLNVLFGGGTPPGCADACDTNDDGLLDVADPVALLGTLFSAAGPLPSPYTVCGEDPTPDVIDCLAPICP
ncbi:MAG: FG-GAP-like repeat-containing protein [Planctomycetota bacterium]